MPIDEVILSAMLCTPRDFIPDCALGHLVWDRDEADRLVIRGWGAFEKKRFVFRCASVVRNTSRRERERMARRCQMMGASILKKLGGMSSDTGYLKRTHKRE